MSITDRLARAKRENDSDWSELAGDAPLEIECAEEESAGEETIEHVCAGEVCSYPADRGEGRSGSVEEQYHCDGAEFAEDGIFDYGCVGRPRGGGVGR